MHFLLHIIISALYNIRKLGIVLIYQPPDPLEQVIPDRYPACAVTRAMAKKAKLNHGMHDIDLTDRSVL